MCLFFTVMQCNVEEKSNKILCEFAENLSLYDSKPELCMQFFFLLQMLFKFLIAFSSIILHHLIFFPFPVFPIPALFAVLLGY